MKVPYWHIDAFASRPFGGNQAAVMPLEAWLPDETLLAIAAENLFAETAFVVRDEAGTTDWELRWFTPTEEVRLCGHATLAAGHVLLSRDGGERVTFTSGPYRVVGYLHAMPTADAFVTFERRANMVPLTEARILIPRPDGAPGSRRIVSGGTLIVNRTLMRNLAPWHEGTEYPAVTARFGERMPIKDMTGGSLVA
mgnify:CR=1 FL=1